MSQNGKRRASSEDLQEPSSKRQRLGEVGHAATGSNNDVQANITGQSTTTIYGTLTGQAATRGQVNISQTPYGRTSSNTPGVRRAVDPNQEERAVHPSNPTGAKRKRRASSPASDEPSPKQSARAQKRAGLQDAGLNDKERGTVKEKDGQLYCRHPVDNTWVPSVFHSAIRADLIAAASARGSYNVERTRGVLENDETSYLESQRDWSGERQNWPRIRDNILNRHERSGYRGDYHGQRARVWIHTDGRMVIDHDRNPMYRHPDLPDTLSSAIEGWYLEAVMRLDNRIQRESIRGRLPDTRRRPNSRKADPDSMYALTAISNRRLRFRNDEGLVAWESRAGSTELNNYFRSFIPQASLDRNSNEGGRGLDKAERKHAENLRKSKEGRTNNRGTTSSSTTTPGQAPALTPVTTESEGATPAQASQSAYGGFMLPRGSELASPSPLAQANGQRLNLGHQAGQAVGPDPFPFLPDEWFNPYQIHHFEPIPSAFTQGHAVPVTAPMDPPFPPHFDGTTRTGTPSSTRHHNVGDQVDSQPQLFSEPQQPEQRRNGVGINNANSIPSSTNGKSAKAGGSRRGRARWRNDDPPLGLGPVATTNGSGSAGGHLNNLEHASESNGTLSHTRTPQAPTNASNGETGRPLGLVANNVGKDSWDDSTFVAGVTPEWNNSDGNRRVGGSVQKSTHSFQEALVTDVNDPLVDDGLGLQLGDNPFASHDGWPTALDFELLDLPEPANTYVEPHSSEAGLSDTPNGIAGQGSTRQVYYDDSAPLQDGQQNSVWRLDDNDDWVLDDAPEETVWDRPVIASADTANCQTRADTKRESLAAISSSSQLYQTVETGMSMGGALLPTAPTAHRPTQPTPPSAAIHQHAMSENNLFDHIGTAVNTSSPLADTPSTNRTEDAQPAEEIDPHHAIPTNHFQYATIQRLLEPTRAAFRAAFQDDSWRSYVPRDYVPSTDRSLSYQGALEQLWMDFLGDLDVQIWGVRKGTAVGATD